MNFRSFLRNSLQEQRQALLTEYWGKVGAGIIAYAQDTGNFLLALRSDEVEEPNTWSNIGGAISGAPGERGVRSPLVGAKKEFAEETGYMGEFEQVTPLYVFRAPRGKFEYHNFLAVVPEEFDPRPSEEHGWETRSFVWMPLKAVLDLPRKHPGLKMLLSDPASIQVLKKLG
jgi:8-oxo-dGTP pyrophosphatase MutT (NUDIX family)